MAFQSTIHGRLEINGKVLDTFTVRKDHYTYFILAELTPKGLKVFWSDKSDGQYQESTLEIISNMTHNIYNFFAEEPATENVNDSATELVKLL